MDIKTCIKIDKLIKEAKKALKNGFTILAVKRILRDEIEKVIDEKIITKQSKSVVNTFKEML